MPFLCSKTENTASLRVYIDAQYSLDSFSKNKPIVFKQLSFVFMH